MLKLSEAPLPGVKIFIAFLPLKGLKSTDEICMQRDTKSKQMSHVKTLNHKNTL